jgi:hypothetical protein
VEMSVVVRENVWFTELKLQRMKMLEAANENVGAENE